MFGKVRFGMGVLVAMAWTAYLVTSAIYKLAPTPTAEVSRVVSDYVYMGSSWSSFGFSVAFEIWCFGTMAHAIMLMIGRKPVRTLAVGTFLALCCAISISLAMTSNVLGSPSEPSGIGVLRDQILFALMTLSLFMQFFDHFFPPFPWQTTLTQSGGHAAAGSSHH